MGKQIEIIPSQQINRDKWDQCIRNSLNPVIYACSFYLDHLAVNWHGIVAGDYEVVMPAPWKKKYAIRYSYHVPFVQQLGWFGGQKDNMHPEMLSKFFGFMKYGDYTFNYGNAGYRHARQHCNFILPLSQPYEEIVSGYNKDLVLNLRKARKENFGYGEETVEVSIRVYQDIYASKTPHVTNDDYNNFLGLSKLLSKKGDAFARKITNEKNEILAIALLLRDGNRLYNMMNSTTLLGRRTGANHLLFDEIFREFAGKKILFDFEGSDIPGIKTFYEKFGAVNQPYVSLHFNNLPFPFRLLKS